MGAASNLSTIVSQTAMIDSNASENSWLFENPTTQTKLIKAEVENEKILSQRFEEKLRNLLENPANSSFDYFDALF
uniref:Uncharacterized protein n=1 Tax=Ciona savignyi TaxID=51511 RepID=H2ZEK4_CIOSA